MRLPKMAHPYSIFTKNLSIKKASHKNKTQKGGIPKEFQALYHEAIQKAQNLVSGIKNTGYNSGGVNIRDYSKYFPLHIIAYDLHRKALRLVSITSPDNPKAASLQESLEDTLIDIINYAAFGYAESQLRIKESQKESQEDGHSQAAKSYPC